MKANGKYSRDVGALILPSQFLFSPETMNAFMPLRVTRKLHILLVIKPLVNIALFVTYPIVTICSLS